MSIWSKIFGLASGERIDASLYAFVDVEVGVHDSKVHDIGALRYDNAIYHGSSQSHLSRFLKGVKFVCGHNIVRHDARFLQCLEKGQYVLVDTLYISPLLFPERPYHRLVKDDKLVSDQLNNPVNDCEKARELLFDEIERWNALDSGLQSVFAALLAAEPEFSGFMRMVGVSKISECDVVHLIKDIYKGRICENADVESLVAKWPIGLAYALAFIDAGDSRSVTPGWVLHTYPEVESVLYVLRQQKCSVGCAYCNFRLDANAALLRTFGYQAFRTYDDEPLQENAVKAAVRGESLLAIFPTGGGKSLTFQLPALMAGQVAGGLTVVISPLQSLMKDQIDNLAERGITEVATINGMLDPIERSLAIERVASGEVAILYIAPEMLRSTTIERILLKRNVVRFVVDEAHCFSAWGQDFRVDYLYIGKFIANYMKAKGRTEPITVSCFTATAKRKVVQDICDYFNRELGLKLRVFASGAARTNLHYSVIHADSDEHKYAILRELIDEADCPTIVYVSRTRRTFELAEHLTRDGYTALPFNGRMDRDEKVANQDAFMSGRVNVIVATSAFGMGVDKRNVGLVVHYDISDSLENYVQEAGRAGRDPAIQARCYVLYGDNDLDKHFILLNQTKLCISEIQQVWQAVKRMTRYRPSVNCSALEIAREAGWDDSVDDIETRVRTALGALEQCGYLERGNNVPHVYATGITVRNVDEARRRINDSQLFGKDEIDQAVRIIKSIITAKYTAKAGNADAESRIDYLADILGLTKRDVVSAVERMRQDGILSDSKELSAYLSDAGDSARKTRHKLEAFGRLEQYILGLLADEELTLSCKQLNDNAQREGLTTSTEKDIRTLLYFLSLKGYMRKRKGPMQTLALNSRHEISAVLARMERRLEICRFAVDWLYRELESSPENLTADGAVRFSIVEILNEFKMVTLYGANNEVHIDDVEEALLYLSKIGALKLEGGFLVLYNAMSISRIKDPRTRYRQDDYRLLDEFYKHKIQQIHIVGEYANLMVRDYSAALGFVKDYFQMDFKKFIGKYFKGERTEQIRRNLTPARYDKIFGALSPCQKEILSDSSSKYIVVAAGPGSGKTRVLVHKLASLLTLEDVKHEQLLMLTFSRAAATEFKQRLMGLIGNAAHYVEIKTFHSFSFDLLGRTGNLDESQNVVRRASSMIENGEVEPNRLGKTVLVIDEAQDMSRDEYDLIRAMVRQNEEMRIIAVGDDDQNIYEFRGSDSGHMYALVQEEGARMIEMTENFRSDTHPVDFANSFLKRLGRRLKNSAIVSVVGAPGYVSVVRHNSRYLYRPLAAELLSHRDGGSACVLTQTNEEASIMTSLLVSLGVRARLIQSLDGLSFRNIAEMRFFMRYIETRIHSPLITAELWTEARQATARCYSGSTSLACVNNCLDTFEKITKAKYLSDFKEYVLESEVEDFYDMDNAEVVVSTIHKAKGREFDAVYMLVTDAVRPDPATLRRLYVGITRARHRLFVHTNGDTFSAMPCDRYSYDAECYDIPDEVVLQLTHKDVYLDYFKDKKCEILELRGGDELRYLDGGLISVATNRPVARFSTKFMGELVEWESRGYAVRRATVRFIVAWRPKDVPRTEPESAVLLADLYLSRKRL